MNVFVLTDVFFAGWFANQAIDDAIFQRRRDAVWHAAWAVIAIGFAALAAT